MERFEFEMKRTLTSALSHPMGEGESYTVSLEFVSAGLAGRFFAKQKTNHCCSLSRRTGEGQGEGFSEIK
jgi:hypothetical protein